MIRRAALAAFLFSLSISAAVAASAISGEVAPCVSAIGAAEKTSRLPARLLDAIGMVESGRPDPARRQVVPWPWTINVAGTGFFYETKAEAIAATENFQAAGVQSIDVGCMQINLRDHPHAFSSLEEAFDPPANAAYAAKFLVSLFHETHSWPSAAAAYHSHTPLIAAAYAQRVMAIWPLASHYGGFHPVMSARPSVAQIDPYRVATPEFAARLLADATWRAARNREMLGLPGQGGRLSPESAPAPERRPAARRRVRAVQPIARFTSVALSR